MLLIITLTMITIAKADLWNNPKYYYKADDGYNDDQGNQSAGGEPTDVSITGVQTYLGNGSFVHDGTSSYIDFDRTYDDVSDWTIGCWVYTVDSGHNNVIWADRGGAGEWMQFVLETSNAVNFLFNDGGIDGISSTLSVADDTWTMVTGVIDSSDGTFLYFNSTQKNTDNYKGGWTPVNDMRLGADYSNPASQSFDGYLDECFYYDVALDQGNITALYDHFQNGFRPTSFVIVCVFLCAIKV